MMSAPKTAALICVLGLGGLPCDSPQAADVYRWVDENGVVNFSDTAPTAGNDAVDMMTLEDSTPPDYDPEEDIYNVAAQAERMRALREQMENERQARRDQQLNPAQQPAAHYQQGLSYGYPVYPRPPSRPPSRPPAKPTPEPYETSTLRLPGQVRDPGGG